MVGWMVLLLLPAGERLPEGVEVDACAGRSDASVYAALHAAGCPRLAFLLTDLDPRDPLDEELASWKIWLVRAVKRARRVAEPIGVIVRYFRGEISAETAHELLHKRVVRLHEWYPGFLVPTFYLHKLGGDTLRELREEALRGDVYAAARLAIDAEMERFARMAEAGFPDAPKIFDRFVDALGELGHGLHLGFLEGRFPPEKLREWEERGIGMWVDGSFVAKARRSDQVPEELRGEEIELGLLPLLRSLAGLLVPIRRHRLDGYLLACVE